MSSSRLAGASTVSAGLTWVSCSWPQAAQKTPTTWMFVDEFPVTASGKIQKYVLRESLLGELSSPTGT